MNTLAMQSTRGHSAVSHEEGLTREEFQSVSITARLVRAGAHDRLRSAHATDSRQRSSLTIFAVAMDNDPAAELPLRDTQASTTVYPCARAFPLRSQPTGAG